MINYLFKDTISIKRKASPTQNSLGEKIYGTETAIYTNIKARIEYNVKRMEYNSGGARIMNITTVYVDKAYSAIKERDLVYSGATLLGVVDTVVPAYGPHGNPVDHYELSWENV